MDARTRLLLQITEHTEYLNRIRRYTAGPYLDPKLEALAQENRAHCEWALRKLSCIVGRLRHDDDLMAAELSLRVVLRATSALIECQSPQLRRIADEQNEAIRKALCERCGKCERLGAQHFSECEEVGAVN